jgi:hypothetical protein
MPISYRQQPYTQTLAGETNNYEKHFLLGRFVHGGKALSILMAMTGSGARVLDVVYLAGGSISECLIPIYNS